jgi:hypothetical protein
MLVINLITKLSARRISMKKLNVKAIVIFSALATAGISLNASSASIAAGVQQIVIADVGSAIFAGSLAFFLVEMFRWERERQATDQK